MTSPARMKTAPVVLASASPRRREMIQALGLAVSVVDPGSGEGPPSDGESPEAYVVRQSIVKANAAAGQHPASVVLAADTAVVDGDAVLGKPATAAEAVETLERLRGRTHRVVTGVTALEARSGQTHSAVKSSDVLMRRFSDEEIARYVASGEPLDKAGSYGVQDAAFSPTERVDGCYLNVMGLPLCEIPALLTGLGVEAPFREGWTPPSECLRCPLTTREGAVQQ